MKLRQLLIFGFATVAAAVALIGILHAADASDGIAVAAVSLLAVVVGTLIGVFVEVDEPDEKDPTAGQRLLRERRYTT